jgi:antitoxin HicB
MATRSKKNPHDGSTLEDWLREEGSLDDVKAEANRRIKRWQLEKEMKKRGEAAEALPGRSATQLGQCRQPGRSARKTKAAGGLRKT